MCCVTGSDDGVLRVWPLDFSTVFIEAGTYTMYVCVKIHINSECAV